MASFTALLATLLMTGCSLVFTDGAPIAERLRAAVAELPGVTSATAESSAQNLDNRGYAGVFVEMKDAASEQELEAVLLAWAAAAAKLPQDSGVNARLAVKFGSEDCRIGAAEGVSPERLRGSAQFLNALCELYPDGVVDIDEVTYGRDVFMNLQTGEDPNADPGLLDQIRALPGAIAPIEKFGTDDTIDNWRIKGSASGDELRARWPASE